MTDSAASLASVPRVSVLMAVRDAAAFLDEALDAVGGQTLDDYEFVIVDDASMDATADILRRRAAADGRLRVIRCDENRGLTRSLNEGLRHCRGEFVARVDGDDVCEPNRFARQVAYCDAHPDLAALATWTTEIDAGGRVIGAHRPDPDPVYIRWALTFENVLYHPTVMMRRAAVDAVAGYDAAVPVTQDHDLFTRIIMHGGGVGILPEPLLRYRRTAGQISSARAGEQRQHGLGVRRRYVAWALGENLGDAATNVMWEMMSLQPLPPGGAAKLAASLALRLADRFARDATRGVRRRIRRRLCRAMAVQARMQMSAGNKAGGDALLRAAASLGATAWWPAEVWNHAARAVASRLLRPTAGDGGLA